MPTVVRKCLMSIPTAGPLYFPFSLQTSYLIDSLKEKERFNFSISDFNYSFVLTFSSANLLGILCLSPDLLLPGICPGMLSPSPGPYRCIQSSHALEVNCKSRAGSQRSLFWSLEQVVAPRKHLGISPWNLFTCFLLSHGLPVFRVLWP